MISITQTYDSPDGLRILSRMLTSEIKLNKRRRLKAYRAGRTNSASFLERDAHLLAIAARATNILSAYVRGRPYSSVEIPREGNEPQNIWTLWAFMKSSCDDPSKFEEWIIST